MYAHAHVLVCTRMDLYISIYRERERDKFRKMYSCVFPFTYRTTAHTTDPFLNATVVIMHACRGIECHR